MHGKDFAGLVLIVVHDGQRILFNIDTDEPKVVGADVIGSNGIHFPLVYGDFWLE